MHFRVKKVIYAFAHIYYLIVDPGKSSLVKIQRIKRHRSECIRKRPPEEMQDLVYKWQVARYMG